MSTTNSKNSMRNALGASLSAESDVFKDRLAKAEARLRFNDENASHVSAGSEVETPAQTLVAPPTKVVREAFTIPEAEHSQIEEVRSRLLNQAVAASKSEIFRAGLALLSQLDNEALVAAMEKLERVKTGRPKTV